MEKKFFGREYGPWITREDFKTRIRNLEEKKKRLVVRKKPGTELRDMKRQIRYLKRIGGV